jgi:hypothetical protein
MVVKYFFTSNCMVRQTLKFPLFKVKDSPLHHLQPKIVITTGITSDIKDEG